mmetsp:Transcript_363/g.1369  ORF Transcript_363/g.1369 Transcript_363/m.1369 type:complete len:573 (-) Transcript_363:127-1845(-)
MSQQQKEQKSSPRLPSSSSTPTTGQSSKKSSSNHSSATIDAPGSSTRNTTTRNTATSTSTSPMQNSYLICSFPSGRQEFIWDNSPHGLWHDSLGNWGKKAKKKKKKKAKKLAERNGDEMGGNQKKQRDGGKEDLGTINNGDSQRKDNKQQRLVNDKKTESTASKAKTTSKAKLAIVTTPLPQPQNLSPNASLSSPSSSSSHPNTPTSTFSTNSSPTVQSSTGTSKFRRRDKDRLLKQHESNLTPPQSPVVQGGASSGGSIQRNITSYYNTNIHSFFKHTTPKVPSSGPYSLADSLWPFFDEPYGIEVPVVLNNERDYVYFVPHLSGYYLEVIDEVGNPALATPIDSSKPSQPGTPNTTTNVHRPKTSSRRCFSHFESKQPSERNYLTDEIAHLAQTHPILLSSSEKLSPASFFSILWVPIMCHNSTVMYLSGEFLCYYGFSGDKEFVRGMKNEDGGPSKEDGSLSEKQECASTTTETDSSSPSHYYVPLIGFAPYKVRNETWFKSTNNTSQPAQDPDSGCSAPLHLIAAVPRILERFTRHLPKAQRIHHDYEHIKTNFVLMKSPQQHVDKRT